MASLDRGTKMENDAVLNVFAEDHEFDVKAGTVADRADMMRMGKVQELRVSPSY